jgi:2-polyprenyl-3-methyl-5-hydroxy-6-metoxy-1,4-benzoquinol methylase
VSEAKRRYYDEAYAVKNIRKPPLPKLRALSYRLKRFELSDYKVVFELLSPGEKLLDVGCGDGSFALMAKNKFLA